MTDDGADDPTPRPFERVAVVALVGAGVVLWIHLMVRAGTGLARLDEPLAEWAAEHAGPTAADLAAAVTRLGQSTLLVPGLAILALLLGATGRAGPRAVTLLLASGLGVWALNNGLKLLVDRDRPDLDPLTGASGSSFPSGHASMAAAGWLAIAIVLGSGRSRRVGVAAVASAVAIAAAVAATRVVLGVHWLTDVVAGLVVGWTWTLVVALAVRPADDACRQEVRS